MVNKVVLSQVLVVDASTLNLPSVTVGIPTKR